MKSIDLKQISVPELVGAIYGACLGQFHAEFKGEIAKENRLIRQSIAVADELKARTGDQRTALVPLLDPNPQVPMMTAQFTLAIAPAAARQALQDLSDRNIYPQAAYACGTLWALERGERKPS